MTESKSLTDVLTRYAALQDLRETWQLGVETLNRILPQYRSKADLILAASLGTALELLDKQLDTMAEFDMKKFSLMRVIDGLPRKGDDIPIEPREETAREERR